LPHGRHVLGEFIPSQRLDDDVISRLYRRDRDGIFSQSDETFST
jgi:hypothetical protein